MDGTKQRQKRVALTVHVSDGDRDAITAKAASSGLPIAEYVRRCALGRQTPSRVDARLINELRRLGGLQKHLYNCDRDLGRQYAEILLELPTRSVGSDNPETPCDREDHPSWRLTRRSG